MIPARRHFLSPPVSRLLRPGCFVTLELMIWAVEKAELKVREPGMREGRRHTGTREREDVDGLLKLCKKAERGNVRKRGILEKKDI